MKRRNLIKKIEKMGCAFIRHGGKHDYEIDEDNKVVSMILAEHRSNVY